MIAAIVLSVPGRQRFKALISWAVNMAPLYHHLTGIATVLLGLSVGRIRVPDYQCVANCGGDRCQSCGKLGNDDTTGRCRAAPISSSCPYRLAGRFRESQAARKSNGISGLAHRGRSRGPWLRESPAPEVVSDKHLWGENGDEQTRKRGVGTKGSGVGAVVFGGVWLQQ